MTKKNAHLFNFIFYIFLIIIFLIRGFVKLKLMTCGGSFQTQCGRYENPHTYRMHFRLARFTSRKGHLYTGKWFVIYL